PVPQAARDPAEKGDVQGQKRRGRVTRRDSAFVSNITPAASVLLARGPGSSEVFLVRRAEVLRFFGGFWAFPGGKAAPDDLNLPVRSSGPFPDAERARLVAAARELFEETGVLVARRTDGSFPVGHELESLRRELTEDRLTFAQVLDRLGAS